MKLFTGDCLEIMRQMPNNSVDLVFTSPPYEDARTYGIGYKLAGDEWVQWSADRYMECLRVSRGLVAWVVEGRTRQFSYTATPFKLMLEVERRGAKLRKPPVYKRVGIPGSGGPDWLRNDYEPIICATLYGRLPWSDNTACGHEPKYGPGGPPSHRTTATRGSGNGDTRVQGGVYKPPAKSNPGNVIECIAGGGHMGHPLAHENEAPFPLKLAEFFVRSFCPPGGTVLDPFIGSGTTAHAAQLHGRECIGIDIRESQVELTSRRIGGAA